jgi:hypothetical protein
MPTQASCQMWSIAVAFEDLKRAVGFLESYAEEAPYKSRSAAT